MRDILNLIESFTTGSFLRSLAETYQFYTRTQYGDALATDLMDDIDAEKGLYKHGTANRYRQEKVLVYPEYDPSTCIVWLDNGSARINQRYAGEAGPIVKFLLSRWPAYGDFETDDGGTLKQVAGEQRVRPADEKNWYHGTSSVHLPVIERFGLQPQGVEQRQYRGLGGSKQGLVYLTSDVETAEFHAKNAVKHFGGAPVVLKINITGLEDRIQTDHDVKHTTLDPGNHDTQSNTDDRRIRRTAGQGSYLTIGTISFLGRIPANRVSVFSRGKESARKPRVAAKDAQFAFVNKLGDLGQSLTQGNKTDFFNVLAASPGGYSKGRKTYPVNYYENTKQLVNSVLTSKRTVAAYASWIRGMYSRTGRWRKHYDPQYKAIAELIAAERDRLAALTPSSNG